MQFFKNSVFLLFSFILLNICFYLFLLVFHQLIPFSRHDYTINSYHFLHDPMNENKQFNLLRSLEQYDSQWYLKIAVQGYPNHPKVLIGKNTQDAAGIIYNFFPLLPLYISLFYLLVRQIDVAAFLSSNILLLLIFFSIMYIIPKISSEKLAWKTVLLLFLFPFSFFFRSNYTESMRLLLLLWFSYFLIQKRFIASAFFLSLLNITSGIVFLLNPFFYTLITIEIYKKRLQWGKAVGSILLSLLPISLWMWFCYAQTGNPFYFFVTRFAWERPAIFPLFYNLLLVTSFPYLPFNNIYGSQIDVISMVLSGTILVFSRKYLHPLLWMVTFILWVSPLLVQDTISFSRFQIVLYPLFLYLAHVLHGKYFIAGLVCFSILFSILSLYFINWYWIE